MQTSTSPSYNWLVCLHNESDIVTGYPYLIGRCPGFDECSENSVGASICGYRTLVSHCFALLVKAVRQGMDSCSQDNTLIVGHANQKNDRHALMHAPWAPRTFLRAIYILVQYLCSIKIKNCVINFIMIQSQAALLVKHGGLGIRSAVHASWHLLPPWFLLLLLQIAIRKGII